MAAEAAPPPSGGGHPSPMFRKTAFSELFAQQSTAASVEIQASLTTHRGEPAVVFKADDIAAAATPFRYTLVGKFSRGRPLLPDLRKFFSTLDLRETISVGLLDARHVLLGFHGEADFLRVWFRSLWYVYGRPMRVCKWTS